MLKLIKAGHREMQRYYPLLETDFDSEELIGRLAMHKGISNGSIDSTRRAASTRVTPSC